MKNVAKVAVATTTIAALGWTLVGCSTDTSADAAGENGAQGDTIAVDDNHGTQHVPVSAAKIAVTDNRSFEILDQWKIPVIAAPKTIVPYSVPAYKKDDSIIDIGSHKEPHLEALVAAQPDLIINGQRFAKHYDDVKKLNPQAAIVEFEPRDGKPFDEELKRHAELLGKTFGKEKEADKLIADFDAALARAKAAYDPAKKVMAVNVSGGKIGYIAPGVGRTYGPIFDLVGITPALKVEGASNNHEGDDISVETIAQSNPDWIFVMDRDAGSAAREKAGFAPAKNIIEANAALKGVTALKDDHVLYAPEDTYTNENIITFTDILNGIADSFEAA